MALIVKHLPDDVTEGELRGLFEPYGDVADINLPRNSDGKAKGFAFVDLSFHECEMDAIQHLDGVQFGAGAISVQKALRREHHKAG